MLLYWMRVVNRLPTMLGTSLKKSVCMYVVISLAYTYFGIRSCTIDFKSWNNL